MGCDGAGRHPRADPADVAAALAQAAQLGPYFGLDDPVPGARPLPELRSAGALGPLVEDHARRLRTGEPRVAASILYQGLAARLWSPVIGCALEGLLLDLDAVAWSADPLRLHLVAPRGWALPPDAAPPVAEAVLGGQLVPLARALHDVAPVAHRLLLGGAASALMGTVTVAELGGRSGARPLADALLTLPPLRGTGTTGPDGAFRRVSCCLYYRVPGGGLCGDCPLPAVPRRPRAR